MMARCPVFSERVIAKVEKYKFLFFLSQGQRCLPHQSCDYTDRTKTLMNPLVWRGEFQASRSLPFPP